MFTGLIETIGTIESVSTLSHNERQFSIVSPYNNVTEGESIAINGVCLTVMEFSDKHFKVYASEETLQRTNLAILQSQDKVNLERSLRLDSFVGGHLVMGHVDETTNIISLTPQGESIDAEFLLTEKIRNIVIEKGSISINGVSLTINAVSSKSFHVNLIPTTRKKTTFNFSKIGDVVNIEIDVITRYVHGILKSSVIPAKTGSPTSRA